MEWVTRLVLLQYDFLHMVKFEFYFGCIFMALGLVGIAIHFYEKGNKND